jgi:hypothetical protein
MAGKDHPGEHVTEPGDDTVNILFRASVSGRRLTAEPVLGEYDPGNLIEIDREIRHMPLVVDHLRDKAKQMLDMIEKKEDFRIIMSTGGVSRARAYVAPANNGGVHLEMADSVLLKAAASMQGR